MVLFRHKDKQKRMAVAATEWLTKSRIPNSE
jgi:hypothetical protein